MYFQVSGPTMGPSADDSTKPWLTAETKQASTPCTLNNFAVI